MVWAHTMVKNEARWLWFAVSSVVNEVDKILLWDTGSTDESLQIERDLAKEYPKKVILKYRPINSINEFTDVRQEMLDNTNSDWILMLDGDEIWWQDSIQKLVSLIDSKGQEIESIVVPTVNVVTDIFHYQDNSAGRYRFGELFGHYNLRAINRNIPGLHSQGVHGVWGWADGQNRMIQERNQNKIKFLNAPYLHTTFLDRATSRGKDIAVIKRGKKLKYEIGERLPFDYFYPESFFIQRPEYIKSPWFKPGNFYKVRAFLETPLRILKRKLWIGRTGY